MEPVTLVLFGATGDLAVKKIFPALASLFHTADLHPDSRIVAVGRRDWDTAAFRSFLRDHDPDISPALMDRIVYADVDFDVRRGYENLKDVLAEAPTHDLLIYLSLAPQWFLPVIEDLKAADILMRGSAKLLLEKPFGTNEASARALNELLHSFLLPEQIFRVDHYLGKATLQALMETHEESTSLRKMLSNETVRELIVELSETKGIDGRGASYNLVGAFKDVGQNHMLEMLAVLMAEYPQTPTAHAWQDARATVIESLAVPQADSVTITKGQYEGYRAEAGAAEDSETETAFVVHTTFVKGELAGIPITLRAGKKMKETYAGIRILFHENAADLEELVFEVQPLAALRTRYTTGRTDTLPFVQHADAYASVIHDALRGETRHFVGSREIIAAWKYTDALLALFAQVPLILYSPDTQLEQLGR